MYGGHINKLTVFVIKVPIASNSYIVFTCCKLTVCCAADWHGLTGLECVGAGHNDMQLLFSIIVSASGNLVRHGTFYANVKAIM